MNIDEIPIVNDFDGRKGSGKESTHKSNLPTVDEDVRMYLRKLGEPVTYFGEGNFERRQRLLRLVGELPSESLRNLNKLDIESDLLGDIEMDIGDEQDETNDEDEEEDFYTPGSQELLNSRKAILHFSLRRAAERIKAQNEAYLNQDFIKILKHRKNINSMLQRFELSGTQSIEKNTRTFSSVKFSHDDSLIATGSWDGSLYILDSKSLNVLCDTGPNKHSEKIGSLDWQLQPNGLLISGDNSGKINLWKVPYDDSPSDSYLYPFISHNSHEGSRITSTKFHPSGNYYASTSFDYTWKFWDINRPETELLQQEGHSKEVYCGSFQPDGSLFASGGLDALIKLWDLRSGRCISNLRGHIKGVYDLDWSSNGFQLASASGDCAAKVWDVRKLGSHSHTGEIFSIPAHCKLVSGVRFFHKHSNKRTCLSVEVTDENDASGEFLDTNGSYLITSSFDGNISIWSADNWTKMKTLQGHTDKVMSCDINGEGTSIATCGWDRTVRLWNIY